MSPKADAPLTLVLRCRDARGIMAAVTGVIDEVGATILDSSHFLDRLTGQLCMRVPCISATPVPLTAARMHEAFAPVGKQFAMTWRLFEANPVGTIIMVSQSGHCLFDLIHAWRAGLLPIRIDAVVSNHATHRDFVEWAGLPFHHLPVTAATKHDSEQRLRALITANDTELVVLARYMQVLTTELADHLAGRCINIHHGFLPSFKGAKPYHKAYSRGVKVIGATAHFVTSDLDEGPIIEQDTTRIDHSLGPDDLIAAGRDVESSVLRRAVLWYAQRRVLLDGGKTVVFH